jgi:hypothetical protein
MDADSTSNFLERVKRFWGLKDCNCTVRWDLEALDNPLVDWDAQQAIEIDCLDDEAAKAVFDNRLNVSYRALEMGARRINLRVQGEMFLPMSPHLTVELGESGDRMAPRCSEPQIVKWLELAGEPEKLSILEWTQESITVRCGDTVQAERLLDRYGLLVKAGLKFVTVYVGKRLLSERFALESLAKDDRHRFIDSLLPTHQEILEVGTISISDVIRLYCRSKEEAIALHDGRWDLCERAQEMQLPQQFELYYFSDDKKPHLYKAFSVQEGMLVKELQRREIAAMFQKLDIADNP